MEMEIFCRNGGVGLERMVASVMEALVVETALVAGKSVMWLLLAVWIAILILVSDSVSYFFFLSMFFQIIIWIQLYRCCYDVGWVGFLLLFKSRVLMVLVRSLERIGFFFF